MRKKYLLSELACYSHDSSDGSAYVDLIRIRNHFAKCLGEVIW